MILANRLRMAAPGGAQASFLGFYSDVVDRTVYTFPAVNFGSPKAGRCIVVAVHGSNLAVALSGVTIGGGSNAVVVQNNTDSGGSLRSTAAVAARLLPDGTAGNVVVTFAGVQRRCGIGVWSVLGLGSAAPVVVSTNNVVSPTSVPLATKRGDFVVGCASVKGTGAYSWTGLAEEYDLEPGGEGGTFSGAGAVADGAIVAGCAFGAAISEYVATFAAFR